MHATRIAKQRDADEAIFVTPDGIVLEAPTSSVFWAGSDGVLKTPSLENPILDSITRDRVVRGLEVEEGTYDVSDFRDATEAFMASTGREVQALSAIDGRELEWPGPHTQAARKAFMDAVEREVGAPAAGGAR
jgi:branched-chain amino acid aminotransferase